MTAQPPPPSSPAGPPAPVPTMPAPRRSGTWQLVVGIILVVIGLPQVIRGISGIIATTTQPGMVSPGVPTGVLVFGLAVVAVGAVLIRMFVRIRAANRAADASGAPTAPPAGSVPPPPPGV